MTESRPTYDAAEHARPADKSAATQRLISQLLESQAEVKRLQRENEQLRQLLDRSWVGVKED